ncbi:MAG TPA: SpoIIE family protein phosphatase [Bacteroidia bacterium]|jgi:serine phosphatase RsbU (regulator of sigma subunit)
MNWWNRTTERFIFNKDIENPETHMKAKFFVGSLFFFMIMCLVSVPYCLVVLPSGAASRNMLLANMGFVILLICAFPVYKKYGGRVLLVNITTLLGYMGNAATYEASGGIFSVDCVWGIIISSWVFLVANKASGYFWMILTMLTYCFFYYADVKGFHDFRQDLSQFHSDYFFYNYFLAGLFMLLIISLYESTKHKFVSDLKLSKSEVEKKSKELEVQKEDIISSINYAKRIQYAVLPQEESIYRAIPLSFILYKPKDIVSGDFFWFHEIDKDNYIIVCADCTGHGVPGAFMTVIGSSLLNQIVIDNKITEPAMILSELDKLINMTLKQQKEHEHYVQDGMDLSLLRVDKSKKEFVFTSAKRPAILIRDKQLQEFKGSKFTLGGMVSGEKKFEEIRMNYQEDDVLYMFTDGYTDQFGGPKGKKYSIKQLRESLLGVHKMQMSEQKNQLTNSVDKWKSELEQVDDILLMGIKF